MNASKPSKMTDVNSRKSKKKECADSRMDEMERYEPPKQS